METHVTGRVRSERLGYRQELLGSLASERILLLGIPGAGKTTTANLLQRECKDFNHVSLGEISRNLQPGSAEALKLAELFRTEQPSGLAAFFLGLVDPYLRQSREGFILDGIPKISNEVAPLFHYVGASLGTDISLILHLQVSPEAAIGRIGQRGMQDTKDSLKMYRRRIALYEPTVRELRTFTADSQLPWISVHTDTLQPHAVVDSILEQYADIRADILESF